MKPTTKIVLALPLALFSSVAIGEPAAKITDDQLVEIRWDDADQSHNRLALPLPLDKSCSTVKLVRDHRATRLNVCRLGDSDPATLQFTVEREDGVGAQKRVMKLHATARVRRGAEVPLGRFQPGDAMTELYAQLR